MLYFSCYRQFVTVQVLFGNGPLPLPGGRCIKRHRFIIRFCKPMDSGVGLVFVKEENVALLASLHSRTN